jgi:hypothetical protein
MPGENRGRVRFPLPRELRKFLATVERRGEFIVPAAHAGRLGKDTLTKKNRGSLVCGRARRQIRAAWLAKIGGRDVCRARLDLERIDVDFWMVRPETGTALHRARGQRQGRANAVAKLDAVEFDEAA